MDIIKEKTVCFTGHRPEKFSGNSGIGSPAIKMIKSMLYYQIQLAIDDGFDNFISGMARGVDLWAAEYVLELKRKYPRIKLFCAVPFKDHYKGFRGTELYAFNNVINSADAVINVSEKYFKGCYSKRNCFMVDNSSRLIAVVENYRSGTGQTISYANKSGIDVKIIDVNNYIQKI